MRKEVWIATLALGLGLVGPAWGQRTLSSYGGIDPNRIVNKPIDLSQAIVAPNATVGTKPFSLTNFLPRLSLPGVRQRMGVSPLPTASSFPSTQYKNGFTVPTPAVPK